MNKLSFLARNQLGMSMVAVIGSISMGIAGITYLINNALPKLQSEKNKIDSQLSYRIFISSLNDYLVHGIRERWCVNYQNGESDLLVSTNCSTSTPMEDIVTYPGNLERILWGPDTIGTQVSSAPTAENANKILALNYQRYHASPRKTGRLLTYEDIAPKDGKLTFKITNKILNDMNETHPLFIMSQRLKECINNIHIEVFQVKDFTNLASGDEKKIGIKISTDIKGTKLSCRVIRTAEAVSYYTFYPRRLHTFSLIKYGNLDGSLYNEFHGPVYVGGNFVLPTNKDNKAKSTIFYNTLTLGVYNGGSKTGNIIPGKIVKSGKPYSYKEWAHPYKSKQDNYDGFRGFLGGVKLDSSEDKGLYNLFDHSNTTAADVEKLEACIEDNESQLKKSKNSNSTLAFSTTTQTNQETVLKLSFTKRNRFSISNFTPAESNNPENNYFKTDLTKKDDSKALAEVQVNLQTKSKGKSEVYTSSLGDNTPYQLNPNLAEFHLDQKSLKGSIEKLTKVSRNNYNKTVESKQLRRMDQYKDFEDATEDLIKQCDKLVAPECGAIGYPPLDCSTPNPGCQVSYSKNLERYNDSKKNLNQYLDHLTTLQADQEKMALKVEVKQVEPVKGKPVLNQRYLSIKTPEGWREFQKIISNDLHSISMTFNPYHNGVKDSLTLDLDLSGNKAQLITIAKHMPSNHDLVNNWRNALTNAPESEPPPLFPLDCPQGMGMADWDLDMSKSSNFAWNYANTPPGANVDSNDHQQAAPIIFTPGNPPLEGHAYSQTKSVVEECIIPPDRTHVYGFYVCNKLTIQSRTQPLYMIGTFIVQDLSIPNGLSAPIHWYSIWDTKASDLIMSDLSSYKASCNGVKNLISKTWKDVVASPQIAATVEACGPLDMVTNGPNNFSWTTVDPDIGIAKAGDTMTSQKVNRIQKWIIREDSRKDHIR